MLFFPHNGKKHWAQFPGHLLEEKRLFEERRQHRSQAWEVAWGSSCWRVGGDGVLGGREQCEQRWERRVRALGNTRLSIEHWVIWKVMEDKSG